MIIHQPRATAAGDDIRVSSRIEMAAGGRRGFPDALWFRFPSWSKPSEDADPFAVALLLLAMQNSEDIQIEGSLSRALHEGLEKYQRVFNSWYPERFHLIRIKASRFRDDSENPVQASACAFSGGVDSFYTFQSLRKELSHTIFMAGFDMPLGLRNSIGELTRSFSDMMKDSAIGFIAGSTNVRNFVNPVEWTNAHGSALAATALFFKNQWSRFYVPSSYTVGSYPKWGTHPELEPLLSTESMRFIHQGSHANRVKKLELIAESPESHERLRVCWIQDLGLRNCGSCEKCIRTMVALDILGVLSRYKTFGCDRLDRRKIRTLEHRTHQSRLFALELMKESARRWKFRTCLDLGASLLRRELFYRLK